MRTFYRCNATTNALLLSHRFQVKVIYCRPVGNFWFKLALLLSFADYLLGGTRFEPMTAAPSSPKVSPTLSSFLNVA